MGQSQSDPETEKPSALSIKLKIPRYRCTSEAIQHFSPGAPSAELGEMNAYPLSAITLIKCNLPETTAKSKQ